MRPNDLKENMLPNSEEIVDIKERKIISPWRNVGEFREMNEWIYGQASNQGTWQRALVELKIWINRRRSQCPAAVFATHTMLDIKLTDEQQQCSEDKLQLLYAFALVRFFNFMSSTIQTHNMRSMYTTAVELGLESFVVDVRHICAHGTELPELSVLRHTADYCLRWLRDYFWRVQSEKMTDAVGKNLKYRTKALRQRSEEIENLFSIYDMALQCHLSHCKTLKDAKKVIHGRRLAKFKTFWHAKKIGAIEEIFDHIVLDMYAVTKCGISPKNLATLFVKEFLKMQYFFAVAETHHAGHALEDLFDVVQNLFRFLAVYNVVDTILQRLFEIAESPQDIPHSRRIGASFWAEHIVEGFLTFTRCKKMFFDSFDEDPKVKFDLSALNLGKFSKNVRETYIYNGVNMKRIILFGDSFKRPWVWHFSRQFLEQRIKAINQHTAPTLPCLMSLIKPKMTDAETRKLNKLISTYIATQAGLIRADDEDTSAEEKVYTIADLNGNSNAASPAQKSQSKENDAVDVLPVESNWTSVRDDGHDWTKCPIGRLPWQ